MSYRTVKEFNMEDHGLQQLRVGDVNGDGFMEFIFAQAYPMNREICAITAIDMDGNILWRHGDILDYCDYSYSDYPFQVYDWDGDGQQEVLYVKQAYYKTAKVWCYSQARHIELKKPSQETLRFDRDIAAESALEYEGSAYLMVLDGSTGNVKEQIPIPSPADDSFLLAHFDGTGKSNLLVKDRYWNIWALDHEGNVLWHINKYKDKIYFGHSPVIGDMDGDGFDELFITDTLFDHDGSVAWKISDVKGHQDAGYIINNLPEPILVTIADKLRMINHKGEVLWEVPGGHFQMAYVGRLFTDPQYGPYQILALDHAPITKDYLEGTKIMESGKNLGQRTTLFDFYGNVIWSEETEHINYRLINWKGDYDCIIRHVDRGLFVIRDLVKGTVESITYDSPQSHTPGSFESYYLANFLGDVRDEIIAYSNNKVNIIMNTDAYNLRRHYNFSVYQPTL